MREQLRSDGARRVAVHHGHGAPDASPETVPPAVPEASVENGDSAGGRGFARHGADRRRGRGPSWCAVGHAASQGNVVLPACVGFSICQRYAPGPLETEAESDVVGRSRGSSVTSEASPSSAGPRGGQPPSPGRSRRRCRRAAPCATAGVRPSRLRGLRRSGRAAGACPCDDRCRRGTDHPAGAFRRTPPVDISRHVVACLVRPGDTGELGDAAT